MLKFLINERRERFFDPMIVSLQDILKTNQTTVYILFICLFVNRHYIIFSGVLESNDAVSNYVFKSVLEIVSSLFYNESHNAQYVKLFLQAIFYLSFDIFEKVLM